MRVVTKQGTSQNDFEKLEELTAHFQKTYIKRDMIGRKTLFPIFYAIINKIPCVVWPEPQMQLNVGICVTALFQSTYPSLYTFHEKFQLIYCNQKIVFLNASSGIINYPKK